MPHSVTRDADNSGIQAVRIVAGAPGRRSDMAGGRSLRCGPFAPLPQKTRDPEPGDSCQAKVGLVP
jgi:hypothetical protein